MAVLDTGLDASHPQMAGAIAGGGTDLVDGDGNPSEVVDGIDDNNNGVADEAYGQSRLLLGRDQRREIAAAAGGEHGQANNAVHRLSPADLRSSGQSGRAPIVASSMSMCASQTSPCWPL